MRIRTVISGLALFLAVPLHGGDKTDVMIMNNGDRMTCEVKGLAAGVLYVSFDYIDGTASVDWSKVARLESTRLFVVTTEDGSVYTGRLKTPESPAGRPVKIQVVEASQREVVIERSRVVQMIATSDKFWRRFSGGIGLGVIYSKGNQSTQYSLSADTAYIRQRWNAQASFSSNLSSSTGANASTRNSVNFSASHLLPWNKWYYSGLGAILQSSEQGIAVQTTVGGGIGRYLKNTNRASISVLAGAAWQNTNYVPSVFPVSNQNMAAALIYAEARLFTFSKTNLNATASLLPAVSDLGRLRFNTNVTYYIKLFHNLKWNFSFYGNWDNRPPTGFSGSDYGTSSGLSWTYGLK